MALNNVDAVLRDELRAGQGTAKDFKKRLSKLLNKVKKSPEGQAYKP